MHLLQREDHWFEPQLSGHTVCFNHSLWTDSRSLLNYSRCMLPSPGDCRNWLQLSLIFSKSSSNTAVFKGSTCDWPSGSNIPRHTGTRWWCAGSQDSEALAPCSPCSPGGRSTRVTLHRPPPPLCRDDSKGLHRPRTRQLPWRWGKGFVFVFFSVFITACKLRTLTLQNHL